LAAGKCYKVLIPAVFALDASETFFQITAFKKFVYRGADHRPPVAIPLLIAFRVHTLELVKPVTNYLEKR
jgi:hypothetical protein